MISFWLWFNILLMLLREISTWNCTELKTYLFPLCTLKMMYTNVLQGELYTTSSKYTINRSVLSFIRKRKASSYRIIV